MSALPLPHVRLVQAPAAGVRVLLPPGRRRHRGLEHRLANVPRLLRVSVLKRRLDHPGRSTVRLFVAAAAGDGDLAA